VVLAAAADRLSRGTTDSLVIARDLENAGAGPRSLAEPLMDTTSDFEELILAMFGIAGKLERRRIIDRTTRGRADAKGKGVNFGRKPKITPHQRAWAIKRRDKDGETWRSIGRSYNVSHATISRLGSP
jgi:DNA invertase Pin-like site-specific DNA recombinase